MTSPISITRHPGSGRPVVFLHGLASCGAQDWPEGEWADVLDGRPRLVVDLPAHGASPALGPVPTDAVLDALAEGIGAEEVDVVAYSLGARLAWDLVARPAVTVRRLVLGGLSAGEPFASVDLAAARSAIAGGGVPSDPLTAMIVHMISLPGNRPAALVDLIEGLATQPFAPDAGGPRMPVLLLGGADDAMMAGIDGLAALLADARTRRVPGDHLSALHAPEFRAAVRDFLAD